MAATCTACHRPQSVRLSMMMHMMGWRNQQRQVATVHMPLAGRLGHSCWPAISLCQTLKVTLHKLMLKLRP